MALTDDGFVIEVHESEHAVSTNFSLWRRVGQISGTTIEWIGGAADFDNGAKPSVACGGNRAIQTHQSSDGKTLWFANSLIADRSGWMQDNLQKLQDKPLKQVALPASHDSGMYKGDCGQTQYKDLYDQLSYGIRYFDLRPACGGVPPVFSIYHGICTGPYLSNVLADIARFMNEGHRELVILKFSHYSDNFTDDYYKDMVKEIQSSLGKWLFTTLPPASASRISGWATISPTLTLA